MIEGRRQKAESRSRRGFWRSYLLPSAFCLLTWQSFAQDQYIPTTPLPLGDILFSLPTSHIPTDGTFELKFTHRFNQSLDQGSVSDPCTRFGGSTATPTSPSADRGRCGPTSSSRCCARTTW